MKLPRDLSAQQLIKALGKLGYRETRQTGSHVRLMASNGGSHHLTIPLHNPLKIGTLAAILADVATQQGISREELCARLFDA